LVSKNVHLVTRTQAMPVRARALGACPGRGLEPRRLRMRTRTECRPGRRRGSLAACRGDQKLKEGQMAHEGSLVEHRLAAALGLLEHVIHFRPLHTATRRSGIHGGEQLSPCQARWMRDLAQGTTDAGNVSARHGFPQLVVLPVHHFAAASNFKKTLRELRRCGGRWKGMVL